MNASEWLTLGGLIGAAVGFLVGLWRYGKAQQWKRTEFLAAEMKEFEAKPKVRNAMVILDWNTRFVELFPEKKDPKRRREYVTDEVTSDALVPHEDRDTSFDPTEVAIRDTFDEFLEGLERFASFVESGLIGAQEVEPYLIYWIEILGDPKMDQPGRARKPEIFYRNVWRYIDFYGYTGVQYLCRQFGFDIRPTRIRGGSLAHRSVARTGTPQRRKALVISGGGARGAWAVGALRHLIQDSHESYDLVVGTSTGALISWAAALGRVDLLHDLYTNISREDCLAPQCPLFGYRPVTNFAWAVLASKDSLYRTGRLKKRLEAALTESIFRELRMSGREAAVCVINLQTSEAEYFNSRDCDRRQFTDAVLASASIPVFMPKIKIEGHEQYWFVDGGVRDLLPLGYAIREGATDITAIFLSPKEQGSDKEYKTVLDVGLRTQNVYDSEVGKNDLNMGALITQELVWRERLKRQLISRLGRQGSQDIEEAFKATKAEFEPMADQRTGRDYRAVSLRVLQPQRDIGPALEFSRADMRRYEQAGYEYAKNPAHWEHKAEVPAN